MENELPWYIQHWIGLKDVTTLVITASAATFGLLTYWRNSTTRRAELLTKLHQEFFVSETYRAVRQILDNDSAEAESEREKLVTEEPENFIEFLNFFELAAYFVELRTFKRKDLDALLGYYLQLLRSSASSTTMSVIRGKASRI